MKAVLFFLLILMTLECFGRVQSNDYSNPDIVESPKGWFQNIENQRLLFQPNTDKTPLHAWMGNMLASISNKTLQQLSLPGTHDSGAYNLTTELLPHYTDETLELLIAFAEKTGVPIEDVITPWALAQDKSFYEQLKSGIRYIDLRAGWSGKEWRTFHFEMGVTVSTLLADIRRFLDEVTTEVVVVEVSHLYNSPSDQDKADLVQMIEDNLGPYLYPRDDAFKSTIAQMIKKDQRVLVSLEDEKAIEGHPGIWPGSAMLNSYADTSDLKKMVAYNQQKLAQFNTGSFPLQLFKISWTLTPDSDSISKTIVPGEPHSLIELADKANKGPFDDFTANANNNKQRLGNLFLLDHFETSNVVMAIAKNNLF